MKINNDPLWGQNYWQKFGRESEPETSWEKKMYDIKKDKDFVFYIPSLYYIINIENQQSTIIVF